MSLSIDCTLKICMSIQGQASHRPSSAVRNAACFDDAHSLRRVLTIRGRTGAVVAMHSIPREDSDQVAEAMDTLFSPPVLSQVKFLSSDSPSSKLFLAVKTICPNLVRVSLDPVHLAIVYEHAQWGKRSPGSKVLRRLLRKFTQVDGAGTLSPGVLSSLALGLPA